MTAAGMSRLEHCDHEIAGSLLRAERLGNAKDAHNVRRMFRDALRTVNGLDPDEWTPYEPRHSFVSILSQSGLAIEEISRLMGHNGARVTELVCRRELRPMLESGASVMDRVFPGLLMSSNESGER